MARKTRGVNPNFKLGIEVGDKPIRSGSFLEESGIAPKPSKPAPRPSKPAPKSRRSATTPKKVEELEESKPATRTRLNVRKVTRANLNAVVGLLERAGEEEAVAPSEVVDALVSVAYEARARIKKGGIRRRGKYGTPQHDAYRKALAQSLGEAIADHLAGR